MQFLIFNFSFDPELKTEGQFSKEKRLATFSLHERGFTLVEMLAVIAIFVVVGSISMAILLTSFRTSQKADVITSVQQNGNYALTQMAKTLRNARGLVSPFPCTGSVTAASISVITSDDQQVTYACIPLSSSPATIASNGATLLDTNAVTMSSCSFTCMQANASDLPEINIDFSLQQHSGSKFVEQRSSTSPVTFHTSVVVRNINR